MVIFFHTQIFIFFHVSVETCWKSDVFQQNNRDRICLREQICSGIQGITCITKYKLGITKCKLGMARKTLEIV